MDLNRLNMWFDQRSPSRQAVLQIACSAALHPVEEFLSRRLWPAQLEGDQGIVDVTLVGQEIGSERRSAQTRAQRFDDCYSGAIILRRRLRRSSLFGDSSTLVKRLPPLFH